MPNTSQSIGRHSRRNQWDEKFGYIPGLIITSTITSILLNSDITQWRSSEGFALYVRANPTTVAIVVQVLSHILGLTQVLALSAILRCSFIHGIDNRPFTLHTMQYVQSASIPSLNFSLPWLWNLSLIGPVIFSVLPAAMWSAAITPVPDIRNTTQVVPMSTFQSNNASALFEVPSSLLGTAGGVDGLVVDQQGVFPLDISALKGSIFTAASDASRTRTSGALHAKSDKTAYQYQGRSYGVGSAIGMFDLPLSQTLTYQYQEPGFLSNVTCIHNASTGFYTILHAEFPYYIVSSTGKSPTNEDMGGGFYSAWLLHDIFLWGVAYSQLPSTNHSIFINVLTNATRTDDPWQFADFNATQCRIDFTPKVFDVSVNITSRIINATPNDQNSLDFPDYSDAVLKKGIMMWLLKFSTDESLFGGSMLGRSMRSNVEQLMKDTGSRNNETLLRGMEDYIAFLSDGILVALSSARVRMMNKVGQANAATSVFAVRFGNRLNIIFMFVFNFLVCGIYIFEAARTGFWRNMSHFDLGHLDSLIIGAFKGGNRFAGGSMEALDSVIGSETHGSLSTEPLLAKNMTLRLGEKHSKYPVLIVANSRMDKSKKLPPSLAPEKSRGNFI